MRNTTYATFAIVLSACTFQVQAAPTWTIQDVGLAPGSVLSTDLNDKGQFMVTVHFFNDEDSFNRPYYGSGSTALTALDHLPGQGSTRAYTINNNGQIVGVSGQIGSPVGQVTTWQFGSSAGTGLNATGNDARGNNNGLIAFRHDNHTISTIQNGTVNSTALQGQQSVAAYVFTALNDENQIVVYDLEAGDDAGRIAHVVYDLDSNGPLNYDDPITFGNQDFAAGLNNNGESTGNHRDEVPFRAYAYPSDTLLAPADGAFASTANDLNDAGQIVGWSDSLFDVIPTLWQDDGQVIDLQLASNADELGWDLNQAFAINNKGQVLGWGIVDFQTHFYLLTPVPEPETYAFMLGGLGLMVWLRRRNKRCDA